MLLNHNIMVSGCFQKKKNEKHLIEHTSFIIHFTHCYLQDVVQFKQFIGAIVVTKISSYSNTTTGKFFWFCFSFVFYEYNHQRSFS